MKNNNQFREEVLGSTVAGDVGGLGYNSGNPAVNQERLSNYVGQNTADSDNKNNILGLKRNATEHNIVGFKSYFNNPNNVDRITSKKLEKGKK